MAHWKSPFVMSALRRTSKMSMVSVSKSVSFVFIFE